MLYWGIFPFRLRFINLHGVAWSSPFMRYMPSWWSVFILSWFSSGAFLESFSQAHIFLYFHDSLMELSQAHRLSYHHFSGVHTRSLIHPHRVILESPGRTGMPMLSKLWMVWLFDTEVISLSHLVTCMLGCINFYTGVYSLFFSIVKMFDFPLSFYSLLCWSQFWLFCWDEPSRECGFWVLTILVPLTP